MLSIALNVRSKNTKPALVLQKSQCWHKMWTFLTPPFSHIPSRPKSKACLWGKDKVTLDARVKISGGQGPFGSQILWNGPWSNFSMQCKLLYLGSHVCTHFCKNGPWLPISYFHPWLDASQRLSVCAFLNLQQRTTLCMVGAGILVTFWPPPSLWTQNLLTAPFVYIQT